MGSILHQHILPPDGGGDTLFASMYAAYDALSDRMKAHLDGLTATHDGAKSFMRYADAPHYGGAAKEFPRAVHPVICKHPVTGRKLLYVNHDFTLKINDIPEAESQALLNYLIEHCRKPEFVVRFHWRKYSIAFWDNRCTQHQAVWDYYPHSRIGFRIQIKGTCPMLAA
jgi:taurine dioxygenase